MRVDCLFRRLSFFDGGKAEVERGGEEDEGRFLRADLVGWAPLPGRSRRGALDGKLAGHSMRVESMRADHGLGGGRRELLTLNCIKY